MQAGLAVLIDVFVFKLTELLFGHNTARYPCRNAGQHSQHESFLCKSSSCCPSTTALHLAKSDNMLQVCTAVPTYQLVQWLLSYSHLLQQLRGPVRCCGCLLLVQVQQLRQVRNRFCQVAAHTGAAACPRLSIATNCSMSAADGSQSIIPSIQNIKQWLQGTAAGADE